MAGARRLASLGAGCAAALLVAGALVVPVTTRLPTASGPPQAAAARAEGEIPTLGLIWGRLRGWERDGAGWRLVWQPAHGAWAVRAWVPDAAAPVKWRVDVATWLPGAALGRDAARALAGRGAAPAVPRDHVGRRDWQVGDTRLAGALPVGGAMPVAVSRPHVVGEAVLAGLLLGGAATRRLVPGVASRLWRRAATASALLLLLASPELVRWAPRVFQAGVRPWVAELAFGAAAAMLLGGVAFAAHHFPAVGSAAPVPWLVVAGSAGVLAGRLQPLPFAVDAAAFRFPVALWIAMAVIVGWLAAVASDGVRELLRLPRAFRGLLLLGAVVVCVIVASPWLGVAVAVLAAVVVDRNAATAAGVAAVWGWECSATRAVCNWEVAQWGALALLLIGAGVLAVIQLAKPKAPPGSAASTS
jgi:hypothetical protein